MRQRHREGLISVVNLSFSHIKENQPTNHCCSIILVASKQFMIQNLVCCCQSLELGKGMCQCELQPVRKIKKENQIYCIIYNSIYPKIHFCNSEQKQLLQQIHLYINLYLDIFKKRWSKNLFNTLLKARFIRNCSQQKPPIIFYQQSLASTALHSSSFSVHSNYSAADYEHKFSIRFKSQTGWDTSVACLFVFQTNVWLC